MRSIYIFLFMIAIIPLSAQTSVYEAIMSDNADAVLTALNQRGDIEPLIGRVDFHGNLTSDSRELADVFFTSLNLKEIYLSPFGIQYRTRLGNSFLHLAAKSGHMIAVKEMLDYGYVSDPGNGENETPLLVAARHRNFDVVNVLSEYGADRDVDDVNHFSLLLYAARYGEKSVILQEIARGLSINRINKRGWTALSMAVKAGQTSMVLWLLENGADILLVPDCLLTAVDTDNEEMLYLLLEHGAPMAYSNSEGNTAFHMASFYKLESMVRHFLLKGADVNTINIHGWTPSFMLIRSIYSFRKTMDLLPILMPDDINHRDVHGRTMLFYAVAAGNFDVAEYLISQGCDPSIADHSSKTAADMLKSNMPVDHSLKEWQQLLQG